MKLLLLCFLSVAAVAAQTLSPINYRNDYESSTPTSAAVFPWSRYNTPNLVNAVDGIPFLHSALIVNGNLAVSIHDNQQTPCKRGRPKLSDGYIVTSEDEEYITAIKFHPIGQNWNEARKTCFREGGFLAYATNKEEENLYLKMMDENKLNDLWVGIHDYFQDGDFTTVLGEVANEVASYTWLPGEPNNDHGPEQCTHYRRVGANKGLNDRTCFYNYAFNCKIKVNLRAGVMVTVDEEMVL